MIDFASEPEPSLVSESPLTPERVRALAERSVQRGLTSGFQALLVATIQALDPLAAPVHRAVSAALSMGQKARLEALAAEIADALVALQAGVSEQGLHLMPRRADEGSGVFDALRQRKEWMPRLRAKADRAVHGDGPAPEWEPSKRAVDDVLRQTAEHLDTLVFGQPAESSASLLGQQVSARLRAHQANLKEDSTTTAPHDE